MRIPHGVLKKIQAHTGLPTNYLSDLAAARKRPGRVQAKRLEAACSKIGLDVRASIWLYGTMEQIKTALSGQRAA